MFSIHNIPLCDSGFYINLDSCIERNNFIKNQIEKYNIRGLERFSAETDELRQYSCTKSHRAVFEKAIESNLNSIFVAEDDFEIYSDCYYFNNYSIKFIDFITQYSDFITSYSYDVLMFGCNPKKNIIPLNEGFGFNLSSTGAWAYIIRKNAMKYILDNYNYYRDYHAIDDILPTLNNKGFTTLATIPMTIGHRNGIPSTLQPHVGDTYYSGWISGNWHKHLYEEIYNNNTIDKINDITSVLNNGYNLEKKLTIVITGHCVENWLFYLRYLLHSIPEYLFKCRFLIVYDTCKNDDLYKLHAYFRDIRSDICPDISFVNGGLISSFDKFLPKIQTEYFLLLEHDWVFLNKNNIDYNNLIKSFDKYNFINAVWFSKNDNTIRSFEICDDGSGGVTPFDKETRVSEVPLVTTCRWSNNPAVFRTSKMKEWFDILKSNNQYINHIHQASHNIEENLIPLYREEIVANGWENTKDKWGTYLYGNLDDDAYVAHTDGSRRYQGHSKSQPEINGEEYIKNNPIENIL